jgi:GNAT superfamily N-acetyltransferase
LILPVGLEQIGQAARLASLAWDEPNLQKLTEALRRPDAVALMAVLRGDDTRQPLGVATARVLANAHAISDETVVVPKWRGRGLATRLLVEMAQRLARGGARTLHGQSSERRLKELAFFLRFGFRVVGEKRAQAQDGFADGTLIYATALRL